MDPTSLKLRVSLLCACGLSTLSLLSGVNLNASWDVIEASVYDMWLVLGQYSVAGEGETLVLLGGFNQRRRRLVFDTRTQEFTDADSNWLDSDVHCFSQCYASLNGTLFFDSDESSSLKKYDMLSDTGTVEDWEGAPHSDIQYACGLSLLSLSIPLIKSHACLPCPLFVSSLLRQTEEAVREWE